MTPITFVAFCDICGKKLKGKTQHGLKVSRAMHYKFRHDKLIVVVDNGKSKRTFIKSPAQVLNDWEYFS